MATAKNKGGRPRRVPGETLERLTINLRPSLRFGLELLARVRGVSLSQACEYALATTLRNEKFEGASVFDIADQATRMVDNSGRTVVSHVDPRTLAAFRLPEKLRSPEEHFVLELYESVRPRLTETELEDFYARAAEAFNLGLSVKEVARRFAEEFKSSTAATAKRKAQR